MKRYISVLLAVMLILNLAPAPSAALESPALSDYSFRYDGNQFYVGGQSASMSYDEGPVGIAPMALEVLSIPYVIEAALAILAMIGIKWAASSSQQAKDATAGWLTEYPQIAYEINDRVTYIPDSGARAKVDAVFLAQVFASVYEYFTDGQKVADYVGSAENLAFSYTFNRADAQTSGHAQIMRNIYNFAMSVIPKPKPANQYGFYPDTPSFRISMSGRAVEAADPLVYHDLSGSAVLAFDTIHLSRTIDGASKNASFTLPHFSDSALKKYVEIFPEITSFTVYLSTWMSTYPTNILDFPSKNLFNIANTSPGYSLNYFFGTSIPVCNTYNLNLSISLGEPIPYTYTETARDEVWAEVFEKYGTIPITVFPAEEVLTKTYVDILPKEVVADMTGTTTPPIDPPIDPPIEPPVITPPDGFTLNFDSWRNLIVAEKFPFCIPFDFIRTFAVFSAAPEDFQFRMYLSTSFFTLDHTVDLSPFSFYIMFFRYTVVIWFFLTLIMKTKSLVKW